MAQGSSYTIVFMILYHHHHKICSSEKTNNELMNEEIVHTFNAQKYIERCLSFRVFHMLCQHVKTILQECMNKHQI